MEAFFVVAIAAIMLAVGVLALLALRRMASMQSDAPDAQERP